MYHERAKFSLQKRFVNNVIVLASSNNCHPHGCSCVWLHPTAQASTWPLFDVSGTVTFEASGSMQALLDGSLVSARHACELICLVYHLRYILDS